MIHGDILRVPPTLSWPVIMSPFNVFYRQSSSLHREDIDQFAENVLGLRAGPEVLMIVKL